MVLLVIIVLAIIAVVVVPRFLPTESKRVFDEKEQKEVVKEVPIVWLNWSVRGVLAAIALFCFFQTSFIIVGDKEVCHLNRIYMGSSMEPGQIIAMPWQKGPQARILTAGFHFLPLIRVSHDLEMLSVVTIPEGKYGFITAADGKSMPDGQYIADKWDSGKEMVNAMLFMGGDDKDKWKGPTGTKGPQLTVLKPGVHRVNRYLFTITGFDATDVPIGHVAVIKSNVGKIYDGPPILPTGVEKTNLSVPIVPEGHRGVWAKVLTPNRYYLNKKAYDITIIPTQVQTWKYIGGYTRRYIDLILSDNGKIEQSVRSEPVPRIEGTADIAVLLRVENWDVWQDARIQVQVTPENAPFVVAAAGGLAAIEDKIITPTFRSVLRNEVAKNVPDTKEIWNSETKKMDIVEYMRPRKVLDLLYKRESTESSVEAKMIPEGAKVGLTVMEVRFGDPLVPPELLLPGKRKQLAESLISTYGQERLAQEERVKMEKKRAEANQQERLMESEIGINVADNNANAREKEGSGEEKYMKALARGQEAQANVLGKAAALELAVIEKVLGAAERNPELVKYPNTMVISGGGGMGSLEGAAALLGQNNLTFGLKKRAPVAAE
jgi:regulator of protease activity HflC (stomatin/prohibitin superfamily)